MSTNESQMSFTNQMSRLLKIYMHDSKFMHNSHSYTGSFMHNAYKSLDYKLTNLTMIEK